MWKDVERYEAIVVDPEIDSRTRLRQATLAISLFGKVQQSSDPHDAIYRLRDFDRFDVIFLSHRLGDETVSRFIRDAREIPSSRDAAFVLLLSPNDQGGSTIASSMMNGINGFLFEPFSADSLLEITRLAAQVRAERAQARECAAISLLITQIGLQLDVVWQLRRSGHGGAVSTRSLREMCSVLTSLETQSLDFYYDTICDKWSTLRPPIHVAQKIYNGASKRLRERAEQKVADTILSNTQSDIPLKVKAS